MHYPRTGTVRKANKMADSLQYFRSLVLAVKQFEENLSQLNLLGDRMAADATLKTAAATAAQAQGRSDLTAQDFDNCLAAIAAIQAAHVGNVKAFFYKLL